MVRHTRMKRLLLVVMAGLVVLAAVASCSSSPVRSAAEVTGFASAPLPAGSLPSGPVTVRVTGVEASRLALLVNRLPSVTQLQVHCEEPLGLMYRIVFDVGSLAPSKAVVEGYRCDAAVTVTVAGKVSSWRRDANCMLIRAVRLVLPGQAKATQSLDIGCGS
jgi:hypothetical protein